VGTSAERKRYIAAVMDARGVTYEYAYASWARSREAAEAEARRSASESGGTLVALTSVEEPEGRPPARRLLFVAGVTFLVSGTAIAATMLVGLRLQGAL
jgi:hypothetical protein